jgi:hypothetical protein
MSSFQGVANDFHSHTVKSVLPAPAHLQLRQKHNLFSRTMLLKSPAPAGRHLPFFSSAAAAPSETAFQPGANSSTDFKMSV